MNKYNSTNIDIKPIRKKEKQKYSIRDVRFDTSRYTENKPRIIKKIPLEL